jgi:imidazoleglycerol-phosphate dehydratase
LMRKASVERKSKETSVSVNVNIDGAGKSDVKTGVRFLDHMLDSLSTHSMIDIKVRARGDLQHHTVEDVALTLGSAISKAIGDRKGLTRFGFAIVPMDDALALAAVDLVKRPYSAVELGLQRPVLEDAAREDLEHFFSSIATALGSTIHIKVMEGKNDHHKFEAAVKALALALRAAASADPRRRRNTPSSKGMM